MILFQLLLLTLLHFCYSTSITSTFDSSSAAYLSPSPSPSYYEGQITYEQPSVNFPEATPCVKTLTRTYTTVISYASCRPSDYTLPFDDSDSGCTVFQGKTLCGRCFVYYVWADETSMSMTEHCVTDGCRFISTGDNPHYDCKETVTLSDGCFEITDAQYDWINVETKCPYREDKCTTTTVSYPGISTLTVCPDSILPPEGCEFTRTSVFSHSYLWCKDRCTRLYITSGHIQTLEYPNPCPTPTTVPQGCTEYEGQKYCPPSDNCQVITSTYFEGHGRYLVGVRTTVCNSTGCSFTTIPEFTGFNCDPITRSSSDGCAEVKYREKGTVSSTTTCPSTLNGCTTTTYHPYYSIPYESTITVCPYSVPIPTHCLTTNIPYFSGKVVVSCNSACTKTFSSMGRSETVAFSECPSGTINPPPDMYDHYPLDCVSYRSSIWCPEHCGPGWGFEEYYGLTYMFDTYYCSTGISCLFITAVPESPSFSCVLANITSAT